jgi:hypothetical protein
MLSLILSTLIACGEKDDDTAKVDVEDATEESDG